MTQKSQRQVLIETILNGEDNPQELAFLETLSLAELSRLAENVEDEFDVEGEVTEYDFEDNEL
jgi:hypothetical protein